MLNHTDIITSLLLLALVLISFAISGGGLRAGLDRLCKLNGHRSNQDLAVCSWLVSSGFCSLGAARDALRHKADGVAAGSISRQTSVAEILLNRGEITSRQATQASSRSSTTPDTGLTIYAIGQG